tara:strand:+ start:414 stop:749 length:336 start_codon:yes stop_codon:yes gene_type:complete
MASDKPKLYSIKADEIHEILADSLKMFNRSKMLLADEGVWVGNYTYHLLTEANTMNYKLYLLVDKIADCNEIGVEDCIVKAEEMTILQSVVLQRYYTTEELTHYNISLLTH